MTRDNSPRHWWLPAAVLLPATILGLAACGIPTGESSFNEIPPDDILFDLDETSTSTTTTTTSTTTTTVALLPETTAATSSTTPIRLDPIEIYFLSRGRLQPVVLELPPGFDADQVTDVLESGPPDDLALDTLIESGLIVSAEESEGVLTVDLDEDTFRDIPSFDQSEAIGQILMTMISSLRRVGQVRFTLDGEAIAVKKGNTLLSSVGEALSYDDYVVLLVSQVPPPDSTEDPDDATTTTQR